MANSYGKALRTSNPHQAMKEQTRRLLGSEVAERLFVEAGHRSLATGQTWAGALFDLVDQEQRSA